ncbi:MAG: hypothetical protein KGJ11_01180, partial [Candidatus Omnitrophica bacterium]|nr:hypothetical protein [Candidatus Omnitrophota bacterium]
MKKVIRAIVSGMVTLSFIGVYAVPSSWAVTDEQFQALQKKVDDQNQLLQQLLKQNQQYQQEIQDLKQQQGQTEQTANQAVQTAQAAQAQASKGVQPVAAAAYNVPMENHNFMLVGDGEVKWSGAGGNGKARGSYGLADFAPIFLYRANDKVLFEAGFDTTIANSSFDTTNSPNPGAVKTSTGGNQGYSTTFNLSFAQLDYVFNRYITLIGGLMVLPLGTYSERSAGWLNKLPDDPMARSLLIGSGVGAQLRGAKSIGDNGAQLTYSVYTVNGGHAIDNTSYATTIDSSSNTIQNF